jgi:hypothetical protein
MRFRARLSHENVQELLAVIHSVEKVGSTCALHLTKTTFEIRTPADDTSDVGGFVSLQTVSQVMSKQDIVCKLTLHPVLVDSISCGVCAFRWTETN